MPSEGFLFYKEIMLGNKVYQVVKIDILDSFPLTDIFDNEQYTLFAEGFDFDALCKKAAEEFKKSNPRVNNWEEWAKRAIYEFELYESDLVQGGRYIARLSSLLIEPCVENAFWLAHKYHSGQKRKVDKEAYLTHPIYVAGMLNLLSRSNPDFELLAAALCHDLLEDTSCSEKEIETACGKKVLQIVKSVTNDKDLSDQDRWEEKKANYIATVEAGGEKTMLVCLADKICNIRSLLEAISCMGDNVWSHFNRGKEKKLWFENSVYEMLNRHLPGLTLVKRYRALIDSIK
jgi:hypothetical protein